MLTLLYALVAALSVVVLAKDGKMRHPEAWDKISAATAFDKPHDIPGNW